MRPLADCKRQSEIPNSHSLDSEQLSSVHFRFIGPASDFICKAVNLISNACLSIDGQSQFVPVIKFGMDWRCDVNSPVLVIYLQSKGSIQNRVIYSDTATANSLQ